MSNKNNKYTFWGKKPRGREKALLLEQEMQQLYTNKYYNLWMDKFQWEGLDEEVSSQQKDYIMRKLWAQGTIACRPIDNTDLLAFASYAVQSYNMYDYPETITLIDARNVGSRILPTSPQVVGKDIIIGYAQPNKKSIYSIVKPYIDRIVQVELIKSNNLQLQKMPWLIAVSEEDRDKLEDVVSKILNNELVVFTDVEQIQKLQSLATNTPYILDKLVDYQQQLEHELLTTLGIDNLSNSTLAQTHVSMDAVNSNNQEINAYGSSIESEVKTFIEGINRVFGRNISITIKSKPVSSIHENKKMEVNENEQ